MKRRSTFGSNSEIMSRTFLKLPRLFDIFWPSMFMWPLCIQYRAKGLPVQASLCAISFSWCGKIRSFPPACMSNVSPSMLMLIAEHSICQPGRPLPHGESHDGSPGLALFQSAKSSGSRLCSPGSILAPLSSDSIDCPVSLP